MAENAGSVPSLGISVLICDAQLRRDVVEILKRVSLKLNPDATNVLIVDRVRAPLSVEVDLTPREHDVLERVAVGSSNLEISQALHISVRTVKHHVSNVMSKLGARDRAHAVALALELRSSTFGSGSKTVPGVDVPNSSPR